MSTDMAIDLGNCLTLCFRHKGTGDCSMSPSVVAYVNQNGRKVVLRSARKAKMMLGNPDHWKPFCPMLDGVIAASKSPRKQSSVHPEGGHSAAPSSRPSSSSACTAVATAVERRAIHQSAQMAGAAPRLPLI